MKYIEVSKKIDLAKAVSTAELKSALVSSLERIIVVDETSGTDDQFKIKGTTGSPAGLTRHACVDLDVSIKHQEKDKTARIIISGYARAAHSLTLLYTFAFLALLLVGLLPGFVSTSAEDSDAIDALFFLIFGIFIVFDVNNKLSVTKESLASALDSLHTTFG